MGQTLLAAACELPAGRARALLPAELDPLGDVALVYLTSARLHDPGAPVRATSFGEANIALPCSGPSGPGTWFLRAWFCSPDLLRLAALVGWGGRAAQVVTPRVPFAVDRWLPDDRGRHGGWVAVDGVREVELVVDAADEVAIAATPLADLLTVYGVRAVGGRRDVLVERHGAERVIGCRAGTAELALRGDPAELLAGHRVTAGYLVRFGAELGGYAVAAPAGGG